MSQEAGTDAAVTAATIIQPTCDLITNRVLLVTFLGGTSLFRNHFQDIKICSSPEKDHNIVIVTGVEIEKKELG